MKKQVLLFFIIFIQPTFGEGINAFTNMCGALGYKRLYAVPRNFTCDPGYFLPANAIQCYACPNGYTCSGGTFAFSSKKAQGLVKNGYTVANAANACAINTVAKRMYAVPRNFTCDPGYFLPANAIQCYACPNGYTCSGGTFAFSSKKAQGITRNTNYQYFPLDEHNTCASNMAHVMNGSFKPNIVNLTWNDGTSTNQTQCIYGTNILIPEVQSRPGYTFRGWTLQTNE